jgi:hypothetical protein
MEEIINPEILITNNLFWMICQCLKNVGAEGPTDNISVTLVKKLNPMGYQLMQ